MKKIVDCRFVKRFILLTPHLVLYEFQYTFDSKQYIFKKKTKKNGMKKPNWYCVCKSVVIGISYVCIYIYIYLVSFVSVAFRKNTNDKRTKIDPNTYGRYETRYHSHWVSSAQKFRLIIRSSCVVFTTVKYSSFVFKKLNELSFTNSWSLLIALRFIFFYFYFIHHLLILCSQSMTRCHFQVSTNSIDKQYSEKIV